MSTRASGLFPYFPEPSLVPEWLPKQHAAIADLAARVIFPSLVFGTVLVQQQSQLLLAAGQTLLWLGILAAAEVVIVVGRGVKVFALAAALVIGFRIARIYLGESPAMSFGYSSAYGVLIIVAGAAILTHRLEMLHSQARFFLLLSVPVMLLQIYGVDWVHALRTDLHGFGMEARTMIPTLFESNRNLAYTTIQARPAGLLHANNFLSLVLLLVMAIQFARPTDGRLARGDFPFLAVIALAMAKIVLLGFVVLTIVYAVVGPDEKRRRVLKLWGVLGCFLAIYFVLFPGLFLHNLSPSLALLNYTIRLADLRAALAGIPMINVALQGFGGGRLMVLDIEAGSQSGYAAIARYLPALSVILLCLLPFHFLRMRDLKRGRPELAELARNGLVVAVLAPLITSFIGNPVFALLGAPLALPWIAASSPGVRRVKTAGAGVLPTPARTS